MSSPLDGRIRALARQEATALLGVASGAPDNATPDRVAALEKEVAELRTIVKRLDNRLDAVEKASGQTDQEERPAPRRTRKAAE